MRLDMLRGPDGLTDQQREELYALGDKQLPGTAEETLRKVGRRLHVPTFSNRKKKS